MMRRLLSTRHTDDAHAGDRRMKTQRIRWALMAAAFLALTGGSRADLTGTKIVFDSNRSGNYDLYTVGPDGTGVTQLTNTAANERSPSYSPDGSRIYFTSDASGAANIYVMNADGTHPVRLTTTAGGSSGPPRRTQAKTDCAASPPSIH
ncbi:hypothetical protein HOI71_23200 [Candidatus Poribacteria bacterium]|nr:hypothetical protein [Candidatus Poribacteria bacterium]